MKSRKNFSNKLLIDKIYMNRIKILSIILTVILATGVARSQNRIGVVNDYRLNVGDFDKVIIDNGINVVYSNKADSIGYVNYKCESRYADAVIVSCKEGKLKIQLSPEYVEQSNLPTLNIYSKNLFSINNNSDSTFTAFSLSKCEKFQAKQMGNGTININNIDANEVNARLATGRGNIHISGECRVAKISMIGTGVIQADLLKADDVECLIIGSGSIGCDPLKTLSVKGIGSTKVYYRGNPTIIKKGGGKLIPL